MARETALPSTSGIRTSQTTERLFYKGRVTPDSLAGAFRSTLEANGWRHLSTTTTDKGTRQVYEKAGSSLQVQIYEGWYYTWAEVSATRVIGREQAPAR
jgi:hypothetical protein